MKNDKDFKDKETINNMLEVEKKLLKELKKRQFIFQKIKNPEIKVPKKIKISMRKDVINILEGWKGVKVRDRKFDI